MGLSGAQLRLLRQNIGLSQVRLAELTNLSQHVISAFELEKAGISRNALAHITEMVCSPEAVAKVGRRKRYRAHSYSGREPDPRRASRYPVAPGNGPYRDALAEIGRCPSPRFRGLSLFAGCGGFSLGLRAAGCDIVGYVEIDDALAAIYAENFPGIPRIGRDIRNLTDTDLIAFTKERGAIDILIGGPPCQGFSLAGKRDVSDPRNDLFRDYMRVVGAIRPKVAVLENVRLLTSMKSPEGNRVPGNIARSFSTLDYDVRMFEVNARDYGVPQHRERVFFVAVDRALAKAPTFPSPTYGTSTTLFSDRQPHRSFGDACSDLRYLESNEADETDPLHAAVSHPDHVIDWLWDVPEGGSAHENIDPARRPPSGYNTTYKRQVWDEPGATVQTTFGMISGCRTVHPVATRALTVREAARLQSFPDNYRFVGNLGAVRTGIGNAVPPLLAQSIGRHIVADILQLVEISGLQIEL